MQLMLTVYRFVPGIALLLGWPLLAAKGLDGHV